MTELITKYLQGEASEKEITEIFAWIDTSDSNKKKFIALKKAYAITPVSQKPDAKELKSLISSLPRKKRTKPNTLLKYAAVAIISISLGALLWPSKSNDDIILNHVVLETSDTNQKFELNDFSTPLISTNGQVIAEQRENLIVYNNTSSSETEPVFHTLNIPYGKTYKIILSDGSIVHLNAGSTLKYPTQFSSNSNRTVFLTGEAFFEVTTDKSHPFIVNTGNTNVTVLGTKFNINAYPENNNLACVLVEGSVQLSNKNTSKTKLLKPNEKASWNIASTDFKISKVKSTNLYISWIDGKLDFESAQFSDISKKLERAYNIKIDNTNTELQIQEFTGSIDIKNTTIQSILDLLKMDTPFEYTINNNVVKIGK